MSKFTMSFAADTLDELYASVAAYLDRPVIVSGPTTIETTNGYTITPIPTPPVTPAPPAPAATDEDGPVDASAPAFDRAGTPWDSRIHSSSKAINEDGTWRKRRNLADITYTTVMAEITQKTAGTAPAAPPAIPVPPQVPIPAGNVDASPIPVPPAAAVPAPPMAAPAAATIPVPPAPAADPVPPTPPAPVAAAPVTETAPPVPQAAGMHFGIFMPKISQAMKAGKFGDADLKGYLASWQLTDVGQLASDPVKAEQFYLWLKQSNLVD